MANPYGYLYLIESFEQGASKVGYGTDPKHRVVQMQTGNPQPLILAAALPADYAAERTLHGFIAEHKVRLEWFSCIELLRAIFSHLEEEVAGLEFDDEDHTITAEMVKRVVPIAIQARQEYGRDYGHDPLERLTEPLLLQSGVWYEPVGPAA